MTTTAAHPTPPLPTPREVLNWNPEEAAARGAALLDERVPGWADLVLLNFLDMRSGELVLDVEQDGSPEEPGCVLCHVDRALGGPGSWHGLYERGFRALVSPTSADVPGRHIFGATASHYGFAVPNGETYMDGYEESSFYAGRLAEAAQKVGRRFDPQGGKNSAWDRLEAAWRNEIQARRPFAPAAD